MGRRAGGRSLAISDGKGRSWLDKITGGIGEDLRRAVEAQRTGGFFDRAGGNRSRAGGGGPAPNSVIESFAKQPDAYPSLMAWRTGAEPDATARRAGEFHRHRMIMGTTGRTGDFVYTNERRNLLILGPPRSDKTAGVLIPLILSSTGPVVSTSTKDDVLRATGLARARLGTVWHFGPDGDAAPGCRPLRWSPIGPSKDWSRAIALGKAIVETAEGGGAGSANSENAKFWSDRSSVFISSLLHAAALGDKPMQWLVRAVNGNQRTLTEALDILNDSLDLAASIAADSLEGIVNLQDERTKANILATSATALSVSRSFQDPVS